MVWDGRYPGSQSVVKTVQLVSELTAETSVVVGRCCEKLVAEAGNSWRTQRLRNVRRCKPLLSTGYWRCDCGHYSVCIAVKCTRKGMHCVPKSTIDPITNPNSIYSYFIHLTVCIYRIVVYYHYHLSSILLLVCQDKVELIKGWAYSYANKELFHDLGMHGSEPVCSEFIWLRNSDHWWGLVKKAMNLEVP
jgi:hypothetical protein